MIQNVLVLGAGSAGLLAALSLRQKFPSLAVRIVRSPELGVIGVGEGTTPNFPAHIFDFLGIPRKRFYALVEPTWKLGIRFLWGPRKQFDNNFETQLNRQWADLPMPNGYYCAEEFYSANTAAAMARHGKVFARKPSGAPDVQPWHGFHIENAKLVSGLEVFARESGVEILDGKVAGHEFHPGGGIAAVHLEDGRKLEADFFVDCSGFRSELLGKALGEPFESFDRSLFCDRAVAGGWERGDEPILPYTTAETMEAGWAWQIEHERHINRGYVYSSQFISDDEAAAEFLRKNPKVSKTPRIVKFRSGRHRRHWVENVVAIGNSAGFVEPLEATAIMIVVNQIQLLCEALGRSKLSPTPTWRGLYNEITDRGWTVVRDFLALHYKLNTAIDNPFWRHCVNDTDVSNIAGLLEFYAENGPSGYCRYGLPPMENDFWVEGFLVMLVGHSTPYAAKHHPTPAEKVIWDGHCRQFDAQGRNGLTVAEALTYVRHPAWNWFGDVEGRGGVG